MLSTVLQKVLGAAAAPAIEYFRQRQELRSKERIRREELKDATHQRQIDLLRQGMTADANWEMEFARQAGTSWKDEYTLAVVSIPLILTFTPWGQPIVLAGFAALANTPLWYQIMVQTMFYATVGIKWVNKFRSDT
jgi:hypothetical protein